MNPSDGQQFVIRAAQALHRFGTAVHRLEATLTQTAAALGEELHVFATPTSVMMGFGPPGDQRVTLLRVTPAATDLGRLADLDALIAEVAAGTTSPRDALAEIDRVDARAQRYPSPVVAVAGAVSSGGAAVLFGGSSTDVWLSAALGMVLAALALLAQRSPSLARVVLTLSAFVATGVARGSTAWWPDVHPSVAALSALIVLLPGLSFTTAMIELATGNLASGVARLAGAGVTLLNLILGVAIAQSLVPLGTTIETISVVSPDWQPLVLAVTPISFGVMLKARRKDLPVIVAASVIAWLGSVGGATSLGPQVGAGLGAFLLAAFSNIYATAFDRPATVPLVAGSILLVPGSLGFRSLAALLEGDVLVGVEQAFQMGMVASALAAGIVFGSSLVPPRRAL